MAPGKLGADGVDDIGCPFPLDEPEIPNVHGQVRGQGSPSGCAFDIPIGILQLQQGWLAWRPWIWPHILSDLPPSQTLLKPEVTVIDPHWPPSKERIENLRRATLLVYTGLGTSPARLHSAALGAAWPVSPPLTFLCLVHRPEAPNGAEQLCLSQKLFIPPLMISLYFLLPRVLSECLEKSDSWYSI